MKASPMRAVVAGVLAATTSVMALTASPAAAKTSEIKGLIKPLERSGYECVVKKEVVGYREASCVRGMASVSVVAFKDTATLRSWEPFYCALGLQGYVTNNQSWILSSSTVKRRTMKRGSHSEVSGELAGSDGAWRA